MKKMKLFLIGLSLLMILVGCQSLTENTQQGKENTNDPVTTEPTENEDDAVEEETTEEPEDISKEQLSVIKAKAVEHYPRSLYDSTEFDIDQDGVNEIIEMYVNADKHENGDFVWDDGQNWLFVVKDGDVTYPLFDGYVQLSSLKYWIILNNEVPTIILLQSGSAVFHLQTFTFSEEKGGFIQETHFNPDNVNFLYNSK